MKNNRRIKYVLLAQEDGAYSITKDQTLQQSRSTEKKNIKT